MATVIPVGDPVNEAERRTIAHLRDNLPSSYIILHNFEVERGSENISIDSVGDKSYNAIEHHIYLPDSGELFLVKSGRALQDALFQVQEQHQIRMEDWVFDVSYNREGGRGAITILPKAPVSEELRVAVNAALKASHVL